MAAFFGQIIGFGFNNSRRQPQLADPMADDFAQQIFRERLRVAVEKAIRQGVGGELWGRTGHDDGRLRRPNVTG